MLCPTTWRFSLAISTAPLLSISNIIGNSTSKSIDSMMIIAYTMSYAQVTLDTFSVSVTDKIMVFCIPLLEMITAPSNYSLYPLTLLLVAEYFAYSPSDLPLILNRNFDFLPHVRTGFSNQSRSGVITEYRTTLSISL